MIQRWIQNVKRITMMKIILFHAQNQPILPTNSGDLLKSLSYILIQIDNYWLPFCLLNQLIFTMELLLKLRIQRYITTW